MTQKITLRFFTLTIGLLLLYAVTALMSAAKFLSANDPLFSALPYNHISGLANVLLQLAVLSGLLGGGVHVTRQHKIANLTILNYSAWAWVGLAVLATLAGLLNISDGRNLLEMPTLLKGVMLVCLVLIAGNILLGTRTVPVVQLWAIGMLLSASCTLISLLPAADYVSDRVLRTLAVGLNINLALPLAAFALGFWLMHRFSNVTPNWADTGIYTVAGLITLAGVLVSLPPLYHFGAPEWTVTLGNLALIVVPILYLIIAAHSYRALADRNTTYTFAAHWFALGLLLLLIGVGFLGAILAPYSINQYTIGTRLSDLQTTLTLLGLMAMGLGVINQGVAELRGHNQKVTGLTPFWLAAFGVIGGGIALGAAGVVQTFTERQLSVGYLDTQTLIIPLYTGWFAGGVALLLGVLIYGLTYWIRRPREYTT